MRSELAGPRGWFALGSLSLALAGLVALQVRPAVAHADSTPLASPVAVVASASPEAGPTLAPTDGPTAAPVAAPAAVPLAVPTRAAVPRRTAKPARPAQPTESCFGPGWQVRRGQQVLGTLRDTGQRSGVTVSFLAARAGYLGLTYPAQHHVDVFVRSCSAESSGLLRHVVSHEMGHAYDAAHMTAALRAAYMAMRGIPAGTPWFGCSYCTDFATPAGDFAETYSQWQRGTSDSRTRMAPAPGPAQLATIAAAFFGR